MLVLLASLLVSCGIFPAGDSPKTPSDGYQLDPVFLKMFEDLGGEALFGKPISPVEIKGDKKIQYVVCGKLIYDKSADATRLFQFAPLGREAVIEEPAVRQPKDPRTPYESGHTILPEFYRLYKKLGPVLVGKPLTEPRRNMIRRRTEQFFENLGFYMIDGASEVRLLAYGSWRCQKGCLAEKPNDPAIIDIQSYIDPVFTDFLADVGADFTGYALSELYLTREGVWEQILENVVLQADTREKPSHIGLRPIVREIGIQGEKPRPSAHPQGAFFYATNGDNEGYDILFPYWAYLSAKGKDRIELSGVPISHNSKFDDFTYHQCFENVCLRYDPTAGEGGSVRPEQLGYAYREMYYPSRVVQTAEPDATAPPTIATDAPGDSKPDRGNKRAISLRIWESYQTLEKKQNQVIQVWVLENNQPIVGGKVLLTVALPNSGESVFEMPPTDANGQSSVTLPKIKAANGVIVPYSACYTVNNELDVCVKDSFVIWDNP